MAKIKICGLSTIASLGWALDARVDFVGFVSFARSPRHVDLAAMTDLAASARGRAGIVALTVDAADDHLDALVAAVQPDYLQLHGRETPERVAAIAARYCRPVIKATGVSGREDIARASAFDPLVDYHLFDAKPPKEASRPGGLGATFDWDLLAGLDLRRPFVLSGGLDPQNVAEAIHRTRPFAVDVSSGVESAPGVKDRALIEAFVAAVREGKSTR